MVHFIKITSSQASYKNRFECHRESVCCIFSLLHNSYNYGNRKITHFFFFLNTSYIYKAKDVFKAKCPSSGISLHRKLSMNKISPTDKILVCFLLLTLKKNPEVKHEDKICQNCFVFVGKWGFPSLKSLQGLHLPLSHLTDHLVS